MGFGRRGACYTEAVHAAAYVCVRTRAEGVSMSTLQRLCVLRHLVILAVAAVLAVMSILAAAPAAHADDEYSITSVNIAAHVQADGTLDVWEERTFDFDGDFGGVYWDISEDAPHSVTVK